MSLFGDFVTLAEQLRCHPAGLILILHGLCRLHHHHDAEGYVPPSALTGDPIQGIEAVLQAVRSFLEGEASHIP